MTILYLFAGFVLGAVAAYFFAASRLGGAAARSRTEADMRLAELESAKAELAKERAACMRLSSDSAAGKAELAALNKKLVEEKGEILKIQEKFSAEFKNLAQEILEEKSRKFTEFNRESIGNIVGPLQERIKDFEKKVGELHETGLKDRSSLLAELRNLKELNQQMSSDAKSLTSALQGEAKSQGDWGELVLEKILEKAGLEPGIHYDTQKTVAVSPGDEGHQRSRPDVIVNLPEGRHMVIDSKVSLTAYMDYCRAEDPKKQEEALKRHIRSLDKHIEELGGKKYQLSGDLKSPDFVLMFIPVEPAFYLAAKSDIGLWDRAFDSNIVIVTGSTLLATMRTVSALWRQDSQNRNAMEIAAKAGELYDKIVDFVKDLDEVGDRIRQLDAAYESARKKIEGKGNMLRKAEDIKKLGARASKQLPHETLERTEQ
jgi:DNA recombination protein RmuC